MPEGSDVFRTRRIERTREFFGARAAGWETRFPDDEPRYQQAVSELAPLANQAALISHLADLEGGLRELGRVCRPGARLALFHPIGRAALGRRHGRELAPDDIRAEQNVRTLLGRADWRPISVDDAEDRYLVLASRQ